MKFLKSEFLKFFWKKFKKFILDIIVSTFLNFFKKFHFFTFSKKIENLLKIINKYYILYVEEKKKYMKRDMYIRRDICTYTYIHLHISLYILPLYLFLYFLLIYFSLIYFFYIFHIWFECFIYFFFEGIAGKMKVENSCFFSYFSIMSPMTLFNIFLTL